MNIFKIFLIAAMVFHSHPAFARDIFLSNEQLVRLVKGNTISAYVFKQKSSFYEYFLQDGSYRFVGAPGVVSVGRWSISDGKLCLSHWVYECLRVSHDGSHLKRWQVEPWGIELEAILSVTRGEERFAVISAENSSIQDRNRVAAQILTGAALLGLLIAALSGNNGSPSSNNSTRSWSESLSPADRVLLDNAERGTIK